MEKTTLCVCKKINIYKKKDNKLFNSQLTKTFHDSEGVENVD